MKSESKDIAQGLIRSMPDWCFPRGSAVKNLPASVGGAGLISGLERSLEEGNGNPLPYSCLGNLMDRGAWQAIVHESQRVRHDLATKEQQNTTMPDWCISRNQWEC